MSNVRSANQQQGANARCNRNLETFMLRLPSIALICATLISSANAGEADVVDAQASKASDGTWRFNVTVRHADTGWDHYANKWEVVTKDGKVLATRVLAHPHVNEQPFTRSKSGIEIPAGIDEVIVRAGDSVHGTGGKTVTVQVK